MRRLKITHFLQDSSYCAVAACSSITNYFNREIDYDYVRRLAHKKISKKIKKTGLDSGQIGLLLNYLGFHKVVLISSGLTIWDYQWANYGRRKMLDTLKHSINNKKDKEEKDTTKNIYKWYKIKGYKNIVKIDYNFKKYIIKHLNKKKPVLLTFNWTMFFKFTKDSENGKVDPINGVDAEHAVVVNGYDEKGVWIVDSHHEFYKYRRKKYKKGFYKISWENLLSCMGQGDIILPDDYYIE